MKIFPYVLCIAGLFPHPATAQERLGVYQRTLEDLASPSAVAFDDRGDRLAVGNPLSGELRVLRIEHPIDLTPNADGSIPAIPMVDSRLNNYPITYSNISPGGVAFSPFGRLWISDCVTGELCSAEIGSDELVRYERSKELFEQPGAIAVTTKSLAVIESLRHEVLIFDHPRNEGADTRLQLRARIGSRGNGTEQLLYPTDLAIGKDERVYICDRGNHRVQVYDREGTHLFSWGDWGWSPGFFADPTGIEIAGERVYVSDSSNHRVQVFDLEGEWLYEWGLHALEPREGEGKLHYPGGLSVTRDGQMAAVAESYDDRVQIYEHGPPPERFSRLDRSWQDMTASPHLGETIAVGGGLLFFGEPEGNRVKPYEWSRYGPRQVGEFGGRGTAHGKLLGLTGMAFQESDRSLLVADPGNARLQLYKLGAVDPETPAYSLSLSRFAKGLRLPTGVECGAIARHEDGSFDLLDLNAREIRRYDPDWSLRSKIGKGELSRPTDIEWDESGERLLITDACAPNDGVAAGRVLAINGEDRSLIVITEGLTSPAGVGVRSDGGFYVTDRLEHKITRHTADGVRVLGWGSKGLGCLQFFQPRDVEVDKNERVLIADHGNHRLMVFDEDGGFLETFGPKLYTRDARKGVQEK
jgi:DNA-binding beta-propeller fold protein YncE